MIFKISLEKKYFVKKSFADWYLSKLETKNSNFLLFFFNNKVLFESALFVLVSAVKSEIMGYFETKVWFVKENISCKNQVKKSLKI